MDENNPTDEYSSLVATCSRTGTECQIMDAPAHAMQQVSTGPHEPVELLLQI